MVPEDGHPELNPRALNEFSSLIRLNCEARGFDALSTAYSDKSEFA